ncbi:cell division protein FtsX [Amaricoccus tamworthensis]|uniref:cell division protein FtsX n=1 Tax=Amaricoccus tamworthensis TaxID=57002 RepID=UPI003C7AE384
MKFSVPFGTGAAPVLPFRAANRRERAPLALACAVLAFFAVLLLCLGLTSARLAETWGGGRSEAATLQILGDPTLVEEHSRAALEILRDTPGVLGVRMIDIEEQRGLLEPWIGADVSLDSLPLPLLMEVETDRTVLDVDGLRAALDAAAPGSVFDDHRSTWLPLIFTARWLMVFSGFALILLTAVFMGVIVQAVRLRLAENRGDIGVIYGLGAEDGEVARGISRDLLKTVAVWIVAGTALAGILVSMLPQGSEQGFFLVGIAPVGWEWIWLPLVALVAFLLAWAGAGVTVRRWLRRNF